MMYNSDNKPVQPKKQINTTKSFGGTSPTFVDPMLTENKERNIADHIMQATQKFESHQTQRNAHVDRNTPMSSFNCFENSVPTDLNALPRFLRRLWNFSDCNAHTKNTNVDFSTVP